MPLDEGLSIMADDASSEREKKLLKELSEDVELGSPFHVALENAKGFPDYVVKMAKLGQQTGTLDQMMEELSFYYEKEYPQCHYLSGYDVRHASGGAVCAVYKGHAHL